MFRTLAFFAYLTVLMVFTVFMFAPLLMVRLLGGRAAQESFIRILTGGWARHLLWISGVEVEVEQRGAPPVEQALCVVANHQGDADILMAVGFVPRLVGFIAKKELKKVPIISWWMQAMHCVFLERASARQALEAIDRAARRMREGQAMIIFPEGTRSRGKGMGRFKPGSMKLPQQAGAAVLPVTIDGTYRLFEETGRIRPRPVRIVFHPVVPADTVRRASRSELARVLKDTIEAPLRE
jgi:1-acyl-sn-glycerol-3-phosphate acyltransferase